MALEVNKIITYNDMVDYVVSYIETIYNNRQNITIPTILTKTDRDSHRWEGYTGRNDHPQPGQGHSSANLSVMIEYNNQKNISRIL